jgi:hypothetical protein
MSVGTYTIKIQQRKAGKMVGHLSVHECSTCNGYGFVSVVNGKISVIECDCKENN